MARIPFRAASRRCVVLLGAIGGALLWSALGIGTARAGGEPLRDAPPIWYENDQNHIPKPEERDPNLYRDMVESSVFDPIGRTLYPPRQIRNVGVLFGGDHVLPAANVNSLDEVPNNSWFTNRIGLFPMGAKEAAAGSGTGTGPDRSSAWTIVSAKTEGVTPGFNIRDARGDVFVIKFDPPGYPGMTSSAGVISGRILHAAGYNVPDDAVVHFRRADLVIGDDVTLPAPEGGERPMTEADLDAILSNVFRLASGEFLGISSKFLEGSPIGPFSYKGTRKDDPNDRVDHEDRRELRGLRVFAAWIYHFDTKQGNSLDMVVEDGGRHFVRHHLIDFASTLGAGAEGPAGRFNHEYTLSSAGFFGRLFTLGFREDAWRTIDRPRGLDEVGFFESEQFDPGRFRPLIPNPAFTEMTDRDAYWAAKIISAFTDEHIEAIVDQGRYMNPEAARYVARVLGQRRNKIARKYFEKIPPLDFFTVDGDELLIHDLGVERELFAESSTRYRSRAAACDADRSWAGSPDWREGRSTRIDLPLADAEHPFLAVEMQVDRGAGWSSSVIAYIAPQSRRIVAVDR